MSKIQAAFDMGSIKLCPVHIHRALVLMDNEYVCTACRDEEKNKVESKPTKSKDEIRKEVYDAVYGVAKTQASVIFDKDNHFDMESVIEKAVDKILETFQSEE